MNKKHLETRLKAAQDNIKQASNDGDFKAFEHWSREAENITEMMNVADGWEDR